jgi:hypothetical protein
MRVCQIKITVSGPSNWTDKKVNDICGVVEDGDLNQKLQSFVESFFATAVVPEAISGLKIEVTY